MSRRATRRELIAGALGTGFALAVRPVSAETITTSADGLEAGDVRIPTSAGEIPAYRAMPANAGKGGGKLPSVILVDSRDLRGARAHPRRLPKAREEGLLRRGARALRPAGRRFEAPRYRRDSRSRRQGARRAGAFRSRRHRCVGQQHQERRRFEARHHGILLGRTRHVALLGAQHEAQGRGRLVRKTHGRQGRSPPAATASKSAARSTLPCSASTARRIRASLSTRSRR